MAKPWFGRKMTAFLYPSESKIVKIIDFETELKEADILALRKGTMKLANDEYGISMLDPNIVDKLISREPISLYELRQILGGVMYASCGFGGAKVDSEIRSRLSGLAKELKAHRSDLESEKRSNLSLRRQMGEADFGSFQKRILISSALSAICSALAAAGSLVVAYLQLKSSHAP